MNFEKIDKNNKIIFKFDNNKEYEKSDLNAIEQDLLNNFDIKIKGENNTIKISLQNREQLLDFLKSEGFYLSVVGFNNEINIGKIKYSLNEKLGLKGFMLYVGGEADNFIDPLKPRYASNCRVEIKDDSVFCGCRIYLQDDNSTVEIGEKCMFSWGIDCWCSDVHTILDMDGNILNQGKSIEIGNHCWIGKDVKIGKNTKISDNSIVGWASVVTKKFDEKNVIIAGNPAKIVKKEINWDARDIQNYKITNSK